MRRLTAFALALGCISGTACFHSSQAWPVALHRGSFVTAWFAVPRSVMVGDDSALVATELSGRVVAYHGDTLTVHLGNLPGQERKAWIGRDATFVLDSAATVRHTEFDESTLLIGGVASIAAITLAIIALIPR